MNIRKCARVAPRARGTTLVELITALAIVAICAGLAVPALGAWQKSAARTSVVNDFMHSIFLARSEAIKRNGVVSICRSTDGGTCVKGSTTWDVGWIVFVNLDRDSPADRDRNEPIIERHASWPTGRVTSNRESYSFRPTTQSDVNGTILFCERSGKSSDARAIIISHTGRPRISKKDASNRALICT